MWSHSAPQLIIKSNSIPLTVTMETTQVVFNNYFLQRSAHTGTHGLCPWTWEVFFFFPHKRVAKVDFSTLTTPLVFTDKIQEKGKGINNRCGMLWMHIPGQDVAVTAHGSVTSCNRRGEHAGCWRFRAGIQEVTPAVGLNTHTKHCHAGTSQWLDVIKHWNCNWHLSFHHVPLSWPKAEGTLGGTKAKKEKENMLLTIVLIQPLIYSLK